MKNTDQKQPTTEQVKTEFVVTRCPCGLPITECWRFKARQHLTCDGR